MNEIYELTYRINGQSERPILRRGTLVELQSAISDALHYDLDYLSLVAERAFTPVPETTTEEILELLEPSWGRTAKETIEVKQTPINTANHKCWSCGKSIYRVEKEGIAYWEHWGTKTIMCNNQETGLTDYAYPVGE